MLIVMYNNRAYYNDWEHQIRMAKLRGTPVERAHIGMDMSGPGSGLRQARAIHGLVRRRPDRRSEEGGRGAQARHRQGEGGAAGAPRHAHAEEMIDMTNTEQAYLRTLGIPGQAVKSVGLIGAGRMGMPLVGHLARKGFSVTVFDVDGTKKAGVEGRGARWAQSIRHLGEESEVVLVCVGYDKELRELLGASGELGKLAAGTIVAILSTVHPRTVVELSKAAGRALGPRGRLHRVPRRQGGRRGHAALASWGASRRVARLTPVLALIPRHRAHRAGGTAQVAKAANNMIMWSCLIANHEALALAKRYGMDPEALREALLISSADNYVLRNWG
jgi:3-hydroxyisobutyrate dehydrogenase-like beta-hydroxyacid dehydrogenase